MDQLYNGFGSKMICSHTGRHSWTVLHDDITFPEVPSLRILITPRPYPFPRASFMGSRLYLPYRQLWSGGHSSLPNLATASSITTIWDAIRVSWHGSCIRFHWLAVFVFPFLFDFDFDFDFDAEPNTKPVPWLPFLCTSYLELSTPSLQRQIRSGGGWWGILWRSVTRHNLSGEGGSGIPQMKGKEVLKRSDNQNSFRCCTSMAKSRANGRFHGRLHGRVDKDQQGFLSEKPEYENFGHDDKMQKSHRGGWFSFILDVWHPNIRRNLTRHVLSSPPLAHGLPSIGILWVLPTRNNGGMPKRRLQLPQSGFEFKFPSGVTGDWKRSSITSRNETWSFMYAMFYCPLTYEMSW